MENINKIVRKDISRTNVMFQNTYHSDNFRDYGKVYFETNEACDKLISQFDVTNKRILTVLSSGDQAFQFYLKGAKRVDLFDINKLTIYYYYLRIWNIKKNGTMYPEIGFDINYIKELLKIVKPKSRDEDMAYKYWSKFVTKFDSKMIKRFFYSPYRKELYKNVDIELLLNIIENDSTKFYNKDISLIFDIPDKYDLIYTSNLSDYVEGDKIKLYRDNLYNHLNDGGIVLSSNLSGVGPSFYKRRIMKKCFKYDEISVKNDCDSEDANIGYSYKKRKFKRFI